MSTQRLSAGRKGKAYVRLILVCLIGLIAASYWYWSQLPQKVDELLGIKLGTTAKEVLYALGTPVSLENLTTQGKWAGTYESHSWEIASAKPDWKTAYSRWTYDIQGPKIGLFITYDTSGKVTALSCIARAQHQTHEPAITGISKECSANSVHLGSSEADVIKSLGEPSSSIIENQVKTMYYPDLNLRILLSRKIIFMVEVLAES